ncbi:tyrosine-type recombinase/integrase [Thalassospiraceae bacterium LMO-JJ14]|nr:tyrosine-type recombinase/integrase [Thalassospiraceae bacterium LMO-JJ14]
MKLHQRGQAYHLRVRVPADLVEIIGRREIHQSLRTSDGRSARSRASTLRATIDAGFDRLRLARLGNQNQEHLSELANAFLVSLGSSRRNGSNKATTKKPLRLRQLMDLHLAEKKPALDPRSYGKMELSFKMALHHMGNIPLKDLDRSVCRAYREALRVTPQFLLRNDTASENTKRVLSDKTINHHLQYLSGLLRWATREELIGGNPAEGLSIRKRQRDWEERFAFDADQLKTLLGSLWTDTDRQERRWVPLIALWSGMRQEEVCQLRHCDIVERDEGHFFVVTIEAGTLKSAAAERLVPVHPRLVKMGLLEEVWNPELGDQRLWPSLKKTALDRYANALCKWFSRYKASKGFNDRRYCFHSLRHTFINAMKQNEVPEPVIRQIVGHQEASLTLGRYGKVYDLEKLVRYMEVIDFDIDLTRPT